MKKPWKELRVDEETTRELLHACKLSAAVLEKILDGVICEEDDFRMQVLIQIEQAIQRAEEGRV